MEKTLFQTHTNYPRPIRLSEETRHLAAVYLSGDIAAEICSNPDIQISFDKNDSCLDRYDRAVQLIAERAPLRIRDEEELIGSATLGGALKHRMPASCDETPCFSSISHTTLGFGTVIARGLDDMERNIAARHSDDIQRERYRISLLRTIKSFRIWHARYLNALKERAQEDTPRRTEWEKRLRIFSRVPAQPPETFREGLQALWILFAFVRLYGNWPGIGRIDELLGPLLEADLAANRITLCEARELIAHFFIKGAEWCGGNHNGGSGDGQHYQNLILAGSNEAGEEVTCTLTYLVLEVLEELPISDYPVGVRLHRNSPPKLIRQVAEVQKYGSGTVSVYNEEVVVNCMEQMGIENAVRFTNDGCWEVLIPGHTAFIYTPFDALSLLTEEVLGIGTQTYPDCPDFERLLSQFRGALSRKTEEARRGLSVCFSDGTPSTVIDIFQPDCIERLRGYNERGCRYNIVSHHLGGFADVVNSLAVIRRLVYREKRFTLPEFLRIVANDYAGEESLRREILEKGPFFGNDDDSADDIAVRILDDYAEISKPYRTEDGLYCVPGISTFGRQIEWSETRGPTPHGFHAHSVLANNAGPTPGTDREGPTALVRSYCKLNLAKAGSGCPLDVKIPAHQLTGQNGICALESLICAFIALGGFYMQTDIVDNEILRRAQLHPEQYPYLSVRIAGWSARFVTLDKRWQDMIIERT